MTPFDFSGRSTELNHEHLPGLQYLGAYSVRLPVSIRRMMENAHDWEHLPYVHASTFGSIECYEAGAWGWRVEVTAPGSNARNVLETLIDNDNRCWATLVLSGYGQGIEIHSQATEISNSLIDVKVRFFSAEKLGWLQRLLAPLVLKRQYRDLYKEDRELMQGRQAALDEMRHRAEVSAPSPEPVLVGNLEQLDRQAVHTIDAAGGRFCVRFHNDTWIVHSAICPHMLGDLSATKVDPRGVISCPWHGYKFDINTGQNVEGKCANLASPPTLIESDNSLYLQPNS